MPERAATLAELRAVREQLHDLTVTLDQQVTDKVSEKVAEATVPREELTRRLRASGKRTVAGLLVLLLLLLVAVSANRLTLQQAQKRQAAYIQSLVRDCSASARLSGEKLAFCRRAIPNFDRSRAATTQRAAEFDSLRQWARSRGWKPPPG